MRRFLCLLLLMCLPLQSFALQGYQLLSADLSHEIQHDHGVQHHHGDDGSINYDNSDESAQHAVENASFSGTAWSPASDVIAGLGERQGVLPLLDRPRFIPDPLPDCPHRPPASSLG